MNNTEDNSVINSSAINQTQSLSNDGSRAGNDLSLAVRIFNGIIISILFTIGASANLIVLHVLRRKRRILLKNTSVILANVMLADLLSCLIVLPHDLIFSVAYLTLPRSKEVLKVCFAIKNAMITLNCSFTMTLTLERTKTATYLGQRRRNRLSWSLKLCLAVIWLSGMAEAVITYMSQNEDERPLLPIKLLGQATSASSHCLSTGTIIAMVLVLAAALVILVSLYHTRRFLRRLNLDAERTFQGFSKKKRRCKM